jgi:hypothetical protein
MIVLFVFCRYQSFFKIIRSSTMILYHIFKIISVLDRIADIIHSNQHGQSSSQPDVR